MWLALLLACVPHLPPDLEPAATVAYTTPDGWRSNVRHYPGDGPPVLLVHGMGANHYNFDFREEVSLAAYLQARGWDVWVPELRGDPGAEPPEKRAGGRYAFDDHALHDLPAIVDAVLAATGAPKLYWVGHSMGGMLLYTALELYPEKIAAGVAIASPVTLETRLPVHRRLSGLGWAVSGHGKLPARAVAAAARPLGRHNPLYPRLANPENLDWPVAHGLARVGLIDLPRPMAKQAVSWMRSGEVLRVDGTPWYRGGETGVPLLALGASVDKVVPAPDVEAACRVYQPCEYVLLGTAGGFAVEYGHVDPVVGRTARDEVYPVVAAFLERHRGE